MSDEQNNNCACGTGHAAPAADTATVGSANLPQKIAPCHCMTGRKLCPWGILAFLILLALGLWVWLGGSKSDGVFSVIPVKASGVRVINCNHSFLGALSQLPLWSDKVHAEKEVAAGFAGSFYKEILFRRADLDSARANVAAMVKRAAVAEIEGDSLYILDSDNAWEIERIITTQVARDYSKDRDSIELEGIKQIRTLNIPGVGTVYLLKESNKVLLTRSREMMAQTLRCRLKREKSLADIGLFWPDESGQRTLACIYVVPAANGFIFPGIDNALYRKDAAVFSEVNLSHDGLTIHVRLLNNKALLEDGGHGFFYYVGVVLLIALIILIGAPLLFVLTTLLLALYFHLAAWWRHELIPIEPAELPEFSAQMKEDLGEKGEKSPPAPDKAQTPQE